MNRPINIFQDVIQALAAHPELREQLRQHLLPQEILELPEKMSQLTNTVQQLSEALADLTAAVSRLSQEQAQMRVELNQVKEDIVVIKQDIVDIKGDIVVIKQDIVEIRGEIGTMGGRISHLYGTEYENRVVQSAGRVLRCELGLARVENPHESTQKARHALRILADGACQDNLITDLEADEMERADLFLIGTNHQGQSVGILAEISVTVQQYDIDRAVQRADLMTKAAQMPTLPVVIGDSLAADAVRIDSVPFIYIPAP